MTKQQEPAQQSVDRRKFLSAGLGEKQATPFDLEADVVVVGSGMAASSAALFASNAGAKVVMLEKAMSIGGTTSKSAGQIWIPANRYLRDAGINDHRDGFLKYVARFSYPTEFDPEHPTLGVPEQVFALMDTYYNHASTACEELAAMGGPRYSPFRVSEDDKTGTYNYANLPDDSMPFGRTLSPQNPDGTFAGGAEAIAQMHAALKARGVTVRLGSDVSSVIQNRRGEVVGVKAQTPTGPIAVRARRGVVFGTGGYTHNLAFREAFQADPIYGGCAVPSATGAFITIGGRLGAKLDNLAGAWRAEVVLDEALMYGSVPEDIFVNPYDGFFYVNKYGKRFVNERRDYHNRARTSYVWDPVNCQYPNLIHFMIYDERTAKKYASFLPIPPNDDAVEYVIKADTFSELQAAISKRLDELQGDIATVKLDASFAANLGATMKRFNEFARTGKDLDFARGGAWEQAWTKFQWPPVPEFEENDLPNKTMYPLSETGPYRAIIIAPGVLDTNGGPVIDTQARVVDEQDQPIIGLYGAGNCIASPARNAYWGAGVTLGLAMTFGMLAGKHAAAEPVKEV